MDKKYIVSRKHIRDLYRQGNSPVCIIPPFVQEGEGSGRRRLLSHLIFCLHNPLDAWESCSKGIIAAGCLFEPHINID